MKFEALFTLDKHLKQESVCRAMWSATCFYKILWEHSQAHKFILSMAAFADHSDSVEKMQQRQ